MAAAVNSIKIIKRRHGRNNPRREPAGPVASRFHLSAGNSIFRTRLAKSVGGRWGDGADIWERHVVTTAYRAEDGRGQTAARFAPWRKDYRRRGDGGRWKETADPSGSDAKR